MAADSDKPNLDFAKWPVSPRSSRRARPITNTGVQEVNCCGALMRCCAWICPPCPSRMADKIAFHPPPRGLFYKIYEFPAYNSVVEDLKEVADGRRLGIRLIFPYVYATHLRLATENVEAFVVKNSRGNHLVGALFRPPKLLNSNEVILFSNPNSMDLGQNLYPSLAYIQRMGCIYGMDIFSYDYSGYGYSEGEPSEANLYSDVEAIHEEIRRLRPHQRVVLVGVSLGTCPSAHLASLNPPGLAGLVMVSGFASGLPIVCGTKPSASPICLDRFSSVSKIPRIDCPILFIHGVLDTMISIKHSEVMHSVAKKPVHPLWICDANHQNIFLHCDVIPRIHKFISQELGAIVTQPLPMVFSPSRPPPGRNQQGGVQDGTFEEEL